jgi:hypothetical protein
VIVMTARGPIALASPLQRLGERRRRVGLL